MGIFRRAIWNWIRSNNPISPVLNLMCIVSCDDPLVLLSLWLLAFYAAGCSFKKILLLLWFMYSRRKYNAAVKFFIMLPASMFAYKMANGIKTEYQLLQIPISVVESFILREKILQEWGKIKKLMKAQDFASPPHKRQIRKCLFKSSNDDIKFN